MSDAVGNLIVEERLPASYRAVVDRWWRPLADRLVTRHAAHGRPMLVGINGAQGSGKSTLARFLELLLAEQGLRAATIALDDLYLPRADRKALARTVHPLLRTRGVPGTHDVALGQRLLDQMLAGRPGTAALPRFDKSSDDRAPDSRDVPLPLDLVLFEGWCVGCPPQDDAALAAPINALEAEEDADGRWRRYVNARLAQDYAALFARIDLLVMLRPPGFEQVLVNRRLQEDKLRAVAPSGTQVMDEAALQRFVAHYERLTRHMLAVLPDRADICIDLDQGQAVTGMAFA